MKKIFLIAILAFLLTMSSWPQEKKQEEEQKEETAAEQPVEAPVFIHPEQPAPQEEAQPAPAEQPEIPVGKISIPRPFIHAGKEYDKGVYFMEVIEKSGEKWFKVSDEKTKDPLFEELAVVKTWKSRGKGRGVQIQKQFLKKFEYFRVAVNRDGEKIMAFFLVKPEAPQAEPKEEKPASPPETTEVSD